MKWAKSFTSCSAAHTKRLWVAEFVLSGEAQRGQRHRDIQISIFIERRKKSRLYLICANRCQDFNRSQPLVLP